MKYAFAQLKFKIDVTLEGLKQRFRNCEDFEEMEVLFEETEFYIAKLKSQAQEAQLDFSFFENEINSEKNDLMEEFADFTDRNGIPGITDIIKEDEEFDDDKEEEEEEYPEEDDGEETSEFFPFPEEEGTKEN